MKGAPRTSSEGERLPCFRAPKGADRAREYRAARARGEDVRWSRPRQILAEVLTPGRCRWELMGASYIASIGNLRLAVKRRKRKVDGHWIWDVDDVFGIRFNRHGAFDNPETAMLVAEQDAMAVADCLGSWMRDAGFFAERGGAS